MWGWDSHSQKWELGVQECNSRKKGQEFDSQPLKVENQPDPGVCRWSATHCWKALKESYKFASDLIPIRGLSRELWAPKVPGVQFGTILGFLLGTCGTKSHSDAGVAEQRKEYYMGKVMACPKSGPWWVKWVHVAHGLSQHQECFRRWTNQLVVGFDAGPSN